jgi:calcyclin binding protein
MVTVFLRKVSVGQTWNYVTEKEAKLKEKSMPKMDENIDPQEGLMSLMKKMYEEGDDEMKRTIAKSFAESREKSLGGDGGMGGLGGLGGMGGMDGLGGMGGLDI